MVWDAAHSRSRGGATCHLKKSGAKNAKKKIKKKHKKHKKKCKWPVKIFRARTGRTLSAGGEDFENFRSVEFAIR